MGGGEGIDVECAAPFRDFPRIGFQWETVLAYHPNLAVGVGNDADGEVVEMDDTVDAGIACGVEDLVLGDLDPRVVVHDFGLLDGPRVGFGGEGGIGG